MIRYPVSSSGETIVFTEPVVAHLMNYRQNHPWQREAGGQLFARFGAGEIFVEEATGPRATDSRGRTYYKPDRHAERREIFERFELGLHYVGDWHTHPSQIPVPSETDIRNINECFEKSRHSLNGFILVLVGTAQIPQGLRVSVHDGSNDIVLEPIIKSRLVK